MTGGGNFPYLRRMVDVSALIRRADRYAKRHNRTTGGVSKLLFHDVRTLELLRQGGRGVTLGRLERAWARLGELEQEARERA